NCRTGIRGLCLFAGEIPAGQDFSRFFPRLVEWVDPKEVRRKDGLDHEMHHQRAKRPLIEYLEVDGSHRPACIGQRCGDRALLCSNEIAGGVAGEIVGAGELSEVRCDARTSALAVLANDGDKMLWRAVQIE